ncbi:MAG: ABC transporter substrate-binding protein [Bdellovibrionales bacterium]
MTLKPWLCLGLMLICGCTRSAKIPDDTLVVAISSEPATLDPRFATDAVGTRLTSLIFNSLVRLGENFEAVPEAAESWTLKGSTYTFKLRRDLQFHNGRPLKAEDVEFSFATALSDGSPYSTMRDSIKKVSVRETDGQIFADVELYKPMSNFLSGELRGLKLLPKAEVLAAGSDFGHHLIGTGGYRLVRQEMNEIELEAVHAKTKHLLFKIIHDDFTRYQKMLKGDIDILQMELTPDRVADFQKRPDKFQVLLYPGLSMTYLLVNFRNPLLKQLPVRQALAQAIERDDMIRYKHHGFAAPATSILTPQNPYFNAKLKPVIHDQAKAAQIIKELGLSGQELTLKTSNNPQAMDNGKVLAYQMSQSGLKVKLQSFEWGTFYGDIKRGDFQLATMKWLPMVDPEIYKMAFHSKEVPPGRNRGYYLNDKLDALLVAGGSEPDFQKRREIFNQVQEIVQSDLAIIPLWYEQQIAIAKKSVTNYHPNQTGDYWSLLEASKVHD